MDNVQEVCYFMSVSLTPRSPPDKGTEENVCNVSCSLKHTHIQTYMIVTLGKYTIFQAFMTCRSYCRFCLRMMALCRCKRYCRRFGGTGSLCLQGDNNNRIIHNVGSSAYIFSVTSPRTRFTLTVEYF
jgi:hypothetical protein